MIFEQRRVQGADLRVYARSDSDELGANRRYPTVLICPGGAYAFCSDREAEPIALAFLAAGYTTAVLRYTNNAQHPTQLHQAAAAVAFLRTHAAEFAVDVARVFVCGFSAGGHLAGMLGTLWNETPEAALARPTGMLLCYPVITAGEHRHYGSFGTLCGPNTNLARQLSLETRVTEATAPAFLWHTADDNCVHVMNSLLLAQALSLAKVPFELHVFPQGAHGLALANEVTQNPQQEGAPMVNARCAEWLPLAVQWMRDVPSTQV